MPEADINSKVESLVQSFDAIPIRLIEGGSLNLPDKIEFLPGVELRTFDGRLKRIIDKFRSNLPEVANSGPVGANKVLIISSDQYLQGLDNRLAREGLKRPSNGGVLDDFVDVRPIVRQVIVTLLLVSRMNGWEIGSIYGVSRWPHPRISGMTNLDQSKVPESIWYGAPAGWRKASSANAFKLTALRLDPYYRSGVWKFNRVSAALGGVWSAMTTSQSHLSFAALCIALEALLSPGRSEISHQLAERCAVLVGRSLEGRLAVYQKLKKIYDTRSKIVHGAVRVKRGKAIDLGTLHIDARWANVPRDVHFDLLGIVLDVLREVLANAELSSLLLDLSSEDKADRAVDEFFLRRLLS